MTVSQEAEPGILSLYLTLDPNLDKSNNLISLLSLND